jgi:hypothetical protein
MSILQRRVPDAFHSANGLYRGAAISDSLKNYSTDLLLPIKPQPLDRAALNAFPACK